MAAAPDFDLVAASLRAESADVATFVEVLARKLSESWPEHVQVDRGGFLGGKHVRRIALALGDASYELEHDAGRLSCRRRTVVRGIALKNEELELGDWVDALSHELVEEAQRTERGRLALERLLGI